jgi:hypothetical protein
MATRIWNPDEGVFWRFPDFFNPFSPPAPFK